MGKQETIRRAVTLRGLRPVMFDRYAGDNKTSLPPEERAYVNAKGALYLPAANISSFLSAENTESAPKRLLGKNWRSVAKAALSFVDIEPFEIPFLREGKPLTVADLAMDSRVARLPKGIPNPKVRPVLGLPWELNFTLTLLPTPDLPEVTLRGLFKDGGICIGLGTFRGVYGKFEVAKWE